MGGFRSPSKTSAVITAATAILAFQTTSAHATSQNQQLRHRNRNLETVTRDYERLGCFKDSKNDRILGHKMVDDEQQTAELCYDYCADLGAPLFATQWSIECWCATEVEVDFGRHGDGAECDHPCAGDEAEMCGGYDAIDLYRIGSDNGSDNGGDNGSANEEDNGSENESDRRVPERTAAPEGALVDDIVKIVEVSGANPGGEGWADSYSVGDKCYMWTTWDHDIGEIKVDTPKGRMPIRELFDLLEEGPGHTGHPLYNDIQCGNGPANSAPDEKECPGLVEHGRQGCGQIGPMWDLSELE